MSVVLFGMEMPDGCENCLLRYRSQGMYCTDHCCATVVHKNINPWTLGRTRNGDKPDWCPLRPLPEKHGDLVDRRTLMDEAKRLSGPITGDGWDNWGVYALIDRQPAIVEAEGD